MATNLLYTQLAAAYAEGARSLLAPMAAAPGAAERGAAAPQPTAEKAETLAPISVQLTGAAAARLEDDNPDERVLASSQLLAKALTDLEISAALLQAAEDEEAGLPRAAPGAIERSGGLSSDLESRLLLIRGLEATTPPALERSPRSPLDPAKARTELFVTASNALDLIRDRSAKTGQAAVAGLIGMGVAEVAAAAGVVGLDIATALGQAEKVTRLYTLFRQFALNAYESILALLGPTIAKAAASKVVEWVSDVLQGEQFAKLLERLYETEGTRAALEQQVQSSQAGAEQAAEVRKAVEALSARQQQQTGLAEKLIRGLGFLAAVPATALPQGQVLRAAAYILLAAFVILSGADYVDAPKLKLIDRVPGVRKVVEAAL